MKILFTLLISFTLFNCLFGQNLITNPDFEQYTVCPTGLGVSNPTGIVGWSNTNFGNVDYFNSCTSNPSVSVPTNLYGTQAPHSGVAYGGFVAWSNLPSYREYFLNHLTSPLIAGAYYRISLYISLPENSCGINHIGAYVSEMPPPPLGNINGPFIVDAQVENHNALLNDYQNWTLITGCFVAEGGEEYLTIGNFYDNSQTVVDPVCFTASTDHGYYYLDDVSIEQIPPPDEYNFDLGDPVTACQEYLIDPGIPNVEYTWEDGSQDPTLLVTVSGTYVLTISDGCSMGTDEIEVNILTDDPPVDIPNSNYTLCQGESLTISLDPNAGTYEWSTGETGPDIEITSSGTYTVTLNDEDCDFTEDQVVVTVNSPPAAFSLGQDTLLCDGEELFISLDPQLGEFHWENGSTQSDHTIFTEGTYSLTISNDCGEQTDEINVSYLVPPGLDTLSNLYSICQNATLTIELDPAMGDFLWQDGSDAYQYDIFDPGHYTVQVTNLCGQAFAEFDVTEINNPLVDLGIDQTLCESQLPVNLDANGSGSDLYHWNDGSSGQQYLVNAAGSYSVTVSNQCGSSIDTIAIVVQGSMVDVNLPDDQLLCTGQSFVIVNSGDVGNYVWQDNSTADTLLVTSPGTYALTVNTLCGTGSDTMILSYIPPVAIPVLGPDQSLCPSQNLVLAPSITGVSFLWQDMSTADTFLVTGAGIYFVHVNDQCSSASDTVQIFSNNSPPDVVLPAEVKLCQGDSVTVDANLSGVNYNWSNGLHTSSIVIMTPGDYGLTVSNACGIDSASVAVLDNGIAPQVYLGNDISLCTGDTVIVSAASPNINTWLWQDGTSASSYMITGSGNVSVEVSNECGFDYDTVGVIVLPALSDLNLGPDTTLCSGQTITLSVDTSAIGITWSDGTVGPDFIIADAGLYYATISNLCGVRSDSISVSISPAIPFLDLGQDKKLCAGDTIVIDPGIDEVLFLWNDGTISHSLEITSPGTIWLNISNACGSGSDTLTIIESTDGPQLDLGQDILGCEGDTVDILSGIDDVDYLWQDGSSAQNYQAFASGTYILQVSNNCGMDRDTIDVDLHDKAPDISLGPDTSLCDGVSLLLTSDALPNTAIQWQDGSDTPTQLISGPGMYSLVETNHCGTDSDSILIDYVSPPKPFTLGADTVICQGDFITLIAPVSQDDFLWQDGSSQPSFLANSTQTYSLQIRNECGTESDEINISIDDHIPFVLLADSIPICKNDLITLDATQLFDARYLWSDGSTTPYIQVESAGDYQVNVSTTCFEESDLVHVYLYSGCEEDREFFIPNVFSPNGDNVNEAFTIYVGQKVSITSVAGSVFDRWGNLIFYSEEIPFTWNGTFHDDLVKPGVYAYRMEIRYFLNGNAYEEILLGDITLIR